MRRVIEIAVDKRTYVHVICPRCDARNVDLMSRHDYYVLACGWCGCFAYLDRDEATHQWRWEETSMLDPWWRHPKVPVRALCNRRGVGKGLPVK